MEEEFEFPKQILNQIAECSRSYLLVTIDERGRFDGREFFGGGPADRIAIAKWLDLYVEKVDDQLRGYKMVEVEEEDDEDDDVLGQD
jgi:hypothetical protein